MAPRLEPKLPNEQEVAEARQIIGGMLRQLRLQSKELIQGLIELSQSADTDRTRLEAIKTGIDLLMELVDKDILTKQAKRVTLQLQQTLTATASELGPERLTDQERENLIRTTAFRDVSSTNRTKRADGLRVEAGQPPVDVPSPRPAEDPGVHREPTT